MKFYLMKLLKELNKKSPDQTPEKELQLNKIEYEKDFLFVHKLG